MTEFNNDNYIQGQIKKQHEAAKCSSVKVSFDEKLFDIDMESLDTLLFEKDIESIQEAVKSEQVTYGQIMRYYWNRCLMHQEYNSVISLNPTCIEEADQMTYDEKHSMIYGLPIVLKDNIGTKSLKTTGGAAILQDFYCDDDSQVVKNLKAQGGIILGKANLSEWANFMSTESSNGYSAIGGQTINPYGSFDVGGSSAGSAVAATLNLSPLTVGTETAGSIIYPSSQNSIVGLKPSLGLIPQDRIIPISETHDTAGPITKSVKDAYYLLSALTNKKLEALENQLKGMKLGIINNSTIESLYRISDPDILENFIQDIKEYAHVTYCKIDEQAFETQVYDILKYEFKTGIENYFKSFGEKTMTLKDIIAFNEINMSDYAPYNHEIILQAATESFDADKLKEQIQINQKITQESLDALLEDYDCLITLSNYMTSVYAPAGYPALTIPAGYRRENEPIGVTFIGKKGDDVKLMNIGLGYETLTKHRQPPEVKS